jgi:hypothetical protein
VSGLPGDPNAIELHLPDGGHVILSIEDAVTRLGSDGDQLIDALIHTEGAERDVERAVTGTADRLDLRCVSSTSHHPTVIAIRRR